MNTVTFSDKDGLFIITVKEEFLSTCPNPGEIDIEVLVDKFGFEKFLHNPKGPAVEYTAKFPKEVHDKLNEIPESKGSKCYWLEGNLLSGEAREKFIHDLKFNDSFEKILSSNEE